MTVTGSASGNIPAIRAKKKGFFRTLWGQKQLMLMSVPMLLYVLLFSHQLLQLRTVGGMDRDLFFDLFQPGLQLRDVIIDSLIFPLFLKGEFQLWLG